MQSILMAPDHACRRRRRSKSRKQRSDSSLLSAMVTQQHHQQQQEMQLVLLSSMAPMGLHQAALLGQGQRQAPGQMLTQRDQGRMRGSESPFACVSAIMGWETFHMVHVLWIGLVDMPGKAPEKDWDMQVRLSCLAR